jgi:hypothetical protein
VIDLRQDCKLPAMTYRIVTATLVVKDEDSEAIAQELNCYLDRIEDSYTLYSSAITERGTAVPANAREMDA